MSAHSYFYRRFIFVLLIFTLAANSNAFAAGPLTPTSAYIQAGFAEEQTRAYVLGLTWDWNWNKQFSAFTASGYFEAAVGRWETQRNDIHDVAWATQVGVTPVIRLSPSGALHHWFAEIGVGANFILPLYRSSDKQFSTEFNFGDHLAIGRRFGAGGNQELAVRVQHFSNGGIDHPNPGENFVQLRYLHRL